MLDRVNLGGLWLKNPVTVASGTFGNGREYSAIWSEAASQAAVAPSSSTAPAAAATPPAATPPLSVLGALITKGVSAKPWPGNPGIRVTETASGLLNSIGLQNPGVEAFCASELPWLAAQDVPVIVNVCGHSKSQYVEVLRRLLVEDDVAAFELNISCPNVDCGGISFGSDAARAESLVAACREAMAGDSRPLIVKLTPNVTDITEVARACESAGADALSLINTVAGMAVDLRRRESVFRRGVAGLSGPAIKPVALYAVFRVHQAVQLPLLGVGGITSGEDAIEFLLAGATAVAVGSASFNDPFAALRIIGEIERWCEENDVFNVNELIGTLR